MTTKKYPSTERFLPSAKAIDTWPTRQIVEFFVNEHRRAFDAVFSATLQITRSAESAAQAVCEGGRLIYVGAGTSGRLAVFDAVECLPTFGLTSEEVLAVMAGGTDALVRSVEGAEDDEEDAYWQMKRVNVKENDVVCGVAASGTTPFTLAALAYARTRGAKTILITCGAIPNDDAGNPIADIVIHLDTGPEVIVGSTRLKAGTAQKITLNAISTTLGILLHKTYGGIMAYVQVANAKLRQRAIGSIRLLTGLDEENADTLFEIAYLPGVEGQKMWVPRAIVMHYRCVDAYGAEHILEKHDGDLRAIIGDIDYTQTSHIHVKQGEEKCE